MDGPSSSSLNKRQRRATEKERESKETRLVTGRYSTKDYKIQPSSHKLPQSNDLRILPSVVLSEYDKAPQLTLCKDQLICYGYEGGYRMVRATHGVHRGSYYWEMEVLPSLGENAHVRVGWSTRQGELQAFCGFDKYSFGYRDIEGSRVHDSQRHDDYGSSFGVGDIIGCYISLDGENAALNKMSFFKNGVDQGVAYSGAEIPAGVYFPAVSLYMKSAVRVNFGPMFIIKNDMYGAHAVSELQPMNPEDRKIHEQNILQIRESRASLNGSAAVV